MDKDSKIKKEVLRYLGYRGQKIDTLIDELIDESIEELKDLIQPRYTYKTFNIEYHEEKILLKGTRFYLPGEDIKKHLKDSKSCILMAASLGQLVDRKIRYYEKVDMAKALILDAGASTFIEELCDRICEDIEVKLIKEDKALTSRFSPGYGDLDLYIQNDFLNLLASQKSIGLTASSNSILIPRKSVTAIMGIVERNYKKEEKSCKDCDKYGDCKFSRGGIGCGY